MKPSAVAPAALTIGVDNNTPPGHNWEYNAFFPETNVSVHQGDVVDFHFSSGSPAGQHTVTFFPNSDTATGVTAFQNDPANSAILRNADTDNGEKDSLQNNNVFLPHPEPTPPGSAPCGFGPFAATIPNVTSPPCVFDNTSPFVSSGALPTGAPPGVPTDFQVMINAPAGKTYTYLCLVHPGMAGTVSVVPATTATTTQAAADAAGATQYNSLTAAALPAEAAAQHPAAPKVNSDGSKTWTQHLGIEVDDVQVLEMLPTALPIAKGDSVIFDNPTTQEIHTATFPLGPAGFNLAPFEQPVCEAAPADTPVPNPNGIPPNGCPSYASYEAPFNLAPQGELSTISSGSTAASSGVLFPTPAPGPHAYTYKFPKDGKFTVFCAIHFGMFGIIATQGYRMGAADGGVFNFGPGMDFFGSVGGHPLNKPVVAISGSFDEQGYYEAASDGGVFTFGDAGFFGSLGNVKLNKPIVGIAPTPDGGGYWMVASDGGVFSFGDATFFGSLGAVKLTKPIVGMASTPDGQGYWLVASDGGVFTFGDAGFLGSLGGRALNQPIVGIAPSTLGGPGYWLVAADGGVFTFGVPFFGSTGNIKLTRPIVGIQASLGDTGYRLVASDGGIFDFGSAPFFGSTGGIALVAPIVGAEGT